MGAQPPRPAASSLRPYFVDGSRHGFAVVAGAVVAAGVVAAGVVAAGVVAPGVVAAGVVAAGVVFTTGSVTGAGVAFATQL